MNAKKVCGKVGMYAFIIIFVLVILLPFVWLLLGSFKSMRELTVLPLHLFPSEWRWDNYAEVFEVQPNFGWYIVNSLLSAGLATILIIIVGSMASYSLARVDIKGKKLVMGALLSITLLPPITLLNPIYLMLQSIGLLNSVVGLALALTAIELPMAVWYLVGFFQSVPYEMEESAMIDGASMTVMFTRILLPLIAPGVFTISIMTFINAWNNYLFAQVFNPLPAARTVTVALTLFQVDNQLPWELLSAAAIIVTLPLILAVLILQKRIISGMMDGGVKG